MKIIGTLTISLIYPLNANSPDQWLVNHKVIVVGGLLPTTIFAAKNCLHYFKKSK